MWVGEKLSILVFNSINQYIDARKADLILILLSKRQQLICLPCETDPYCEHLLSQGKISKGSEWSDLEFYIHELKQHFFYLL